jgi:regulator of sigma E protease
MDTLIYLLLTLLLLSVMVVIHELGHFLFAKLFKVTVLEFSVGMGPAIFTTKKKTAKTEKISEEIDSTEEVATGDSVELTDLNSTPKTDFSIRAFPIGGYVSMAGEDEASTDINAFCNKPAWQRFIITIAGPVMNILLGIICMFSLVGMESAQNDFLASNIIGEFQENAVSNVCQHPLMVGDEVIKVDGVRVHTGSELIYEIMNSGDEPIDIFVIRDGKKLLLEDVVFPTEEVSGIVYGDYDFKVMREDATFANIIKHSVYRSFSTIKMIVDSIKDLIGGRYGVDAVSGPIGMADAVGEATKSGPDSLLFLFTLVTMNLGVFNLIPFPALDGGRIIFQLVEIVFKKPVKKEIEQAINTVGILLLFGLMIFITFKDIFGLFK